ncbi:MAG: hypothetical protein AAFP19_00045 [Bacteroidota bacterium]
MAAPLRYTLTTNPSPLYYTRDSLNPSITNILIAITPEGEEEVFCEALQFTISLGSEDLDLTTVANESSIVTESLQTTWSIERFSAGVYRAYPIAPNSSIKAGEVLTFQLQGVIVNEVAGSTLFDIVANLPEGPDATDITLTKVRSNLEINSFSGNPSSIYPEDSSQLSWSTTAASTVTILPDGPPGLPTNGTFDVSPNVATTYYLTVFGEGPSLTQSFPIQVVRARIIEFTSSDNSIIPGEPVALRWNVEDAASIEISPGDHTDLPPVGTLVVMPMQTTAYSLRVTNVNSEDQRDLVIVVNTPSPEIISFNASPSSFFAPEPVPIQLSWNIENASIVTLSPGSYGPLRLVDSVTVDPTEPTTYTLSASNGGLIDIKQLTVTESFYKSFEYYNQNDALAWIDILTTNLPIGSAVAMFSLPYFSDPFLRVSIPKTTVNRSPNFKATTFCDLFRNTNYTFTVTYYPEGQPNPPNGSIRLDVIIYRSGAAQIVDGKLVLKPISGDNYPEESFTTVFSQEIKIPSNETE